MALDSSADEPQDGRAFMTHVWKGLPLSELTPGNCEALLLAKGAAPAPLGGAGEEGGEAPPEPELSPELRSNMTRAHRSVISSRDRVYASYRLHYAARVKAIDAVCEQAVREEKSWTASWKQLVSRAAIEPDRIHEE